MSVSDFTKNALITKTASRAFVAPAREASRAVVASYNVNTPPPMAVPPTTLLVKAKGVSAVAIAGGGSGYIVGEVLTLAGGTFSTAALLTVVTVSGGAITSVAITRSGVYTVDPTNPVSQSSTTGSGTGATFNLTMAGSAASSITTRQTIAATSSLFRTNAVLPLANISSSGYYGSAAYIGELCWFEFCTNALDINVRLLGFNTSAMIFVDGERVSDTPFATDASGAPYVLTLTFASRQVRRIKVAGINLAMAGLYIATTDDIWLPPERQLAVIIGDSYTYGTMGSPSPTNQFTNYVWALESALNMDVVPLGIGSTGWTSSGANLVTTRITDDLDLRDLVPTYIFWALGYNDAGGNMGTVATNANAAMALINTTYPDAKQFVIGPWTPLGATVNLTIVKDVLIPIAAANDATFIDIDNWVSAANKSLYTGADNVHPTQAGNDYLGGRIAQAVQEISAASLS